VRDNGVVGPSASELEHLLGASLTVLGWIVIVAVVLIGVVGLLYWWAEHPEWSA
jgi:hypothetical protein